MQKNTIEAKRYPYACPCCGDLGKRRAKNKRTRRHGAASAYVKRRDRRALDKNKR